MKRDILKTLQLEFVEIFSDLDIQLENAIPCNVEDEGNEGGVGERGGVVEQVVVRAKQS